MRAGPAATLRFILPRREVALLLAAALLVGPVAAGEILGKVVKIQDGDSLTVLVARTQVRIRLTEIDAPERRQPFGTRSHQSLSEICAGTEARVIEQGIDRYGRTLGRVLCAGIDANAEQVRRGMAWVFDWYVTDQSLYALQEAAKSSKRGLWQDPNPLPPWEWREMKKKR